MTIAIGINAGMYAILAADTRVTYLLENQSFHDDNRKKVYKTRGGLVTGAGFVPLLNMVIKKLRTEEIVHTDQILQIVNESRESIRTRWNSYSSIESAITQTGWIFSYDTQIEGDSILRLAVIHDALKKDITLYGPGDPAIIYPQELSSEVVSNIQPEILEKIIVPKIDDDIQESIIQNTILIITLIQELSHYCKSISSKFQYGIHMKGVSGVSTIFELSEIARCDLSITLNNDLDEAPLD